MVADGATIPQTAGPCLARSPPLNCRRPLTCRGAPAARAQSDLLGKLAALTRVIGGYHRIIGREIPALAILIGGHAVSRLEMALQHFEFLAVFKTNNVIGMD